MEPRVSFITLGVSDLERATRFYRDVLGLPQRPTPTTVAFFEMGKTWLSLYPREALAADAGVPAERSGFPGFALAHNVRSIAEVEALLSASRAAELHGKLASLKERHARGGEQPVEQPVEQPGRAPGLRRPCLEAPPS